MNIIIYHQRTCIVGEGFGTLRRLYSLLEVKYIQIEMVCEKCVENIRWHYCRDVGCNVSTMVTGKRSQTISLSV